MKKSLIVVGLLLSTILAACGSNNTAPPINVVYEQPTNTTELPCEKPGQKNDNGTTLPLC